MDHGRPPRTARLDPGLVQQWTVIGAAAGPADHATAEGAIVDFYRAAGPAAPRVVWARCPLTAILSTIVYTNPMSSDDHRNLPDAWPLVSYVPGQGGSNS